MMAMKMTMTMTTLGATLHLQLVCALHSAPICDEQNAADLPRRRWGVVKVAGAHYPSRDMSNAT
jgi:hypothetical protein